MPDALSTSPRLTWRRRLAVLISVAFVAAFGVWTERGGEPVGWLACLGAGGLAVAATFRPGLVGAVLWGSAIVTASVGSERASRFLEACGALGVLVCVCAACAAIARVPVDAGLTQSRRLPMRLALTVPVAVWSVTAAAPLYPTARPLAWLLRHFGAWDWFALFLSASVLAAWIEWTIRLRRLELAVVERASATRSFQLTSFCVGAVLVAFAPGRSHAVARLVLSFFSACVVMAFVHPDAVRVGRATRRASGLAIVGGAVVFVGVWASQSGAGWVATAIAASAALVVGASVSPIERSLRPEGGAWLDALEEARKAAERADPDDAVRAVLLALRGAHALGEASPELWTFGPGTQTAVDAAGYLRERPAELPDDAIAVAAGEPDGILRSEVLDALEVRRPDLRPLCAWMLARGAFLAALLASEGEPEGLLILPRGRRTKRLTLEEARAVRAVANRLAAACRARGVAARMRARVQEAAQRVKAAEAQADRLSGERDLAENRNLHAHEGMARWADAGIYSASSRMAAEAIEARLASGGPVHVRAPMGLDPVPFLVRAHLTSARRANPLLVVDGTDRHDHDPPRWLDAARSPLALADGGVLALVDAAALPREIQRIVGRAQQDRRAPWHGDRLLRVQIVVTGAGPSDGLLALDDVLSAALGDACANPITLPRLRDRADDLHALLMGALAREGLRAAGQPIGIEPSAYARLTDYEFPGDVAELAVIVKRLVAQCTRRGGDSVRIIDVEGLGLPGVDARSQKSGDVTAPRGRVRKDPISV